MKILEVKNVVKFLAKKQVLHDVSFSVDAWEIYGFLGPNGAGKTTTMKCIMGLIEPEEWEIQIFGAREVSQSALRSGYLNHQFFLTHLLIHLSIFY